MVAEHALSIRAACEDRYHALRDERGRRKAPLRHLGARIGHDIARPERTPGRGVQAVEPARSTEGVDFALMESGRRPRPRTRDQFRKASGVQMGPKLRAGGGIVTDHRFAFASL